MLQEDPILQAEVNAPMQSWHWITWNLFLSAIPVAAAYALALGAERFTLRRRLVPWWAWLPLALLWFAFLPNTCYLLTEWRHFLFGSHFIMAREAAESNRVEMLRVARQGLFFLFYSGFGVLCFTLSIRPIEGLIRRAHLRAGYLAIPFFFLVSLGVYMGLIVRLNSWDIVRRPGYVAHIAWHAVSHALLLQTIIIFAGLLWLLYKTVDIWVDGAAARLAEHGLLPG